MSVVRRLAVVVAVAAMALAMAAPGLAEPDTPEDPGQAPAPTEPAPPTEPAGPVGGAVVDSPTLSLDDLGDSGTIYFYRGTSTNQVSFPVSPGLVPATLNATLDLPFNVRSGLLSVTQDDRLISKLPLPPVDMAPLVIPLPGVQVIDNVVNLTLTLSILPEDGYCPDWFTPFRLINSSITFTGAELPPTVVADFVPPILRKVTIGIPASPSLAESDAAVQLAARLSRRFGGQAPEVALVSLPDGSTSLPVPSAPFEREFIIKEAASPLLSLQGAAGVPQLLISGPADSLTNLSLMVATGALGMAVSPQVVPEKVSSFRWPELAGASATLAQLGEDRLSGSGLSPQVTIAINQTRFGRSLQGVRVHLFGTYTPLPTAFGAQIIAAVDGETIDTWPTDPTGSFDRWVQIPDRLLSRYTQLQVRINTTGNIGGCNDYRPSDLTIHGNSVIEASTASPPIPSGFGSLPQAIMPVIRVGIGDDKFADTARATQIVVGLQRLSPVPFRTSVTTLDKARAGNDSAILISSDGWNDKSINLPVSANDRQITVKSPGSGDSTTVLTLDPGVQFGSLQTVFDGRRTLLIATSNGAPAQLDDLLNWLSADRSRWGQLRGSAIVDVVGRTPVLVQDRTPVNVYGPVGGLSSPSATEGAYHGSPAWWVAALVVGVAAAGVGAIAWSSRRSGAGRVSSSSAHRREE